MQVVEGQRYWDLSFLGSQLGKKALTSMCRCLELGQLHQCWGICCVLVCCHLLF